MSEDVDNFYRHVIEQVQGYTKWPVVLVGQGVPKSPCFVTVQLDVKGVQGYATGVSRFLADLKVNFYASEPEASFEAGEYYHTLKNHGFKGLRVKSSEAASFSNSLSEGFFMTEIELEVTFDWDCPARIQEPKKFKQVQMEVKNESD